MGKGKGAGLRLSFGVGAGGVGKGSVGLPLPLDVGQGPGSKPAGLLPSRDTIPLVIYGSDTASPIRSAYSDAPSHPVLL